MTRDIILLQKRELENRFQEFYVERKMPFPLDLGTGLINVITGPRRAGKSFYAAHLIRQTESYGYINFDDERLADIKNYDEIINAANTVYGNPRYLFFDEIQNLPKWEIFVNRLQRQGLNLLITGSNANLLSSELATHLTGRHATRVLLPFSFGEYKETLGHELTEAEKMEALEIYVEQGGYPEPLIKKIDRREYLRVLLQSILYKDIVKRFKIRSVQGIEDLALYLMSNIAREYSFNALCNITKCRSVHTIDKYILHLQEAYLFFSVPRFSFKVKDMVGRNKKIYCIDNGLAISAGFRASPDRGALYENLVAIALKKQEMAGLISLFYWKSPQNEEVDFVIKEGLHVRSLIQVSTDISNPKTLKREMRSLIKASQELKCDDLLLLNDRIERTEIFKWQDVERSIRLIPLWKWLES